MMVSHTHKFLFIHIQKTGGASIRKSHLGNLKSPTLDCTVLENTGLFADRLIVSAHQGSTRKDRPHLDALAGKQVMDLHQRKWDEYYKFAFVRNPWDRMLSWFFWRQTHPKRPKWWEGGYPNIAGFRNMKANFETFVKNFNPNVEREPGSIQSKMILDNDGEVMVDFVGTYENLQSDFDFICNHLGVPTKKLPHRHKTKHDPYEKYYNKRAKDLVAQREAKIIEMFNYKFGQE